MNKSGKDEIFEEIVEADEDIQTISEEAPQLKRPHKPYIGKPELGITQKLHLVTHRTLSTTERIIQSLTKAYEHIFVADESVTANFEKEYGLKYYSKNDYKNALKHFESYDQDGGKNDAEVLYMMGICHLSEENYKKAAKCFEKADELKPDDFDIVTQLAKCLMELEGFQGALNYFKQSMAIAPDEADIFYYCANCYEKLEQIEEAKKMYRKAIDLNPREAVYYHSLGFLYENIGDHKDAIVCFKKAMDLERERGGGGR